MDPWIPSSYVTFDSQSEVYEIDDQFVQAVKDDSFSQLGLDSARLDVITASGSRFGYFKLVNVQSGDLANELGLQTNDVLKFINGYELGALDGRIDACTALITETEFVLVIERSGNTVRMSCEIMRETFGFSVAHHLPTFSEGHKCRRMPGTLTSTSLLTIAVMPAVTPGVCARRAVSISTSPAEMSGVTEPAFVQLREHVRRFPTGCSATSARLWAIASCERRDVADASRGAKKLAKRRPGSPLLDRAAAVCPDLEQ